MARSQVIDTRKGSFIGSPAYQRIEADMREQIRSGRWPLGSSIPSRRDLARQYGVQLPTLQRAVAALLADGTLIASPRQGTMVGKVGTGGRIEQIVSPPSRHNPIPVRHMNVGILAMVAHEDDRRSNGRNFNESLVDSLELTLGTSEVSSAFVSRGRYNDAVECFAAAVGQGIDALALVLTVESTETIEQYLRLVEKLTIPVVFVTADPVGAPYSTVYYDQMSAGYSAGQHLVRAKSERVVFFAPFKAKWLDERIEGAISAIGRAGLSLDAFSVYPAVHDLDPWKSEDHVVRVAREAAASGFESGVLRGCGVIACNDNSAVELVDVGRDLGLCPGVDYQLVSFDDTRQARELGISSLRPPAAAMGEEAAKLILRHLRGDASVLQISLQSHLVTRASTRPVATRAEREQPQSHA